MNNNAESYDHEDWESEIKRLEDQFNREWRAWEAVALKNIGFMPMPNGTYPRALVYGCGSGIDAYTLSEEGYADYIEGWDSNNKYIERASDIYQHRKKLLQFKNIDLLEDDDLKVNDKFNIIYLRLVLQHIRFNSVEVLLKKLCNLLTSEGKIIVHDVDREAYKIFPKTHPFYDIDQKLCKHLSDTGRNPSIGSFVPHILTRIGFNRVIFKIITHLANHNETMDELVFVTNFSNNVDVISDELWNSACKTKPLNFSRVVVRTITVADKYTARG